MRASRWPAGRCPLATNPRKIRIGIDIDGVLADFSTAFSTLGVSLGLTNRIISADEQPTWEFQWKVDKAWNVVNTAVNWWETLPALITADDVSDINELLMQHQVYFLTNRRDSTMPYNRNVAEQTRNWLKGAGIMPHLGIVLAEPNKAELAKALHLDVVLDDSPANLQDFLEAGVYGVKMKRPYNAGCPAAAEVEDIEQFYCGLADFYTWSRSQALTPV
jgi:uncharacterized HAD superfamily protein